MENSLQISFMMNTVMRNLNLSLIGSHILKDLFHKNKLQVLAAILFNERMGKVKIQSLQ